MKKIIISLFLGFSLYQTYAQQTLSIGTADTKANAVLYLKGDGTQGLIIPVTTNHASITPTEGMIVYNSTDGKIYKCNGTTWSAIEGGGSGTDSQTLTLLGNVLSITGGNGINIGSVAPTQTGQLLMWDGSKWTSSSTLVPTASGQVLKWNATTKIWEAGTDNGTAYTAGTGVSIAGTTITNTGDTDATNDITTTTTATGDLTGTFPSLTIATGAVTSSKLATGSVGLTQLANGPANNVMTTNASGVPTWATGGSGVTSVTATTPITTSGTAAAPVINFPSWPATNAAGALTNNGSGTLSWQTPTTSGTASGDLTGAYPAPAVAKLQGQTVSPTTPTAGQVLQFVAGAWTPQNLATGGTVTNVTGTAPINVATGTTTPVISLANTAVTVGSYGTATAIPQITVDAQGRLTAATNVSIPTANTSTTGLLTNTDWNTFNGKLTNPLTTTGDLLFHNGTTATRLPSASGFLKSAGAATAPTWSALTATDIPALDAAKITTGTLPVARGGTGITAVTNGGVAYGAAGNFAFTPVGTAGQILTSNGAAAPTWTNPGLSSTLTSANIFVGNASNVASAVTMSGDATLSNTGVLTLANSSATRSNLGLGTFATVANPLTTNGDIIYGTAATPTRLPVGSNGQVLTVAAGLPSWQPATGFTNPMTAGNDMIIGGASGIATRLAAPTTNQVLTSDGAGAITWAPHLASIPRTANLVFASPNGSGGVPTFRTLFDADIAPAAAIVGSKINPAFGAQNISTTSGLAVGAGSEFTINNTGNITKINNVTTSFPAAQGAANSFLKNDGAGNLTWATPSGFTTTNVIPKGSSGGLVGSSIFDDGAGHVGIGTITPTQQLDVFGGSINTNTDYMINGTSVLKNAGSNVAVGGGTPSVGLGSNNTMFGITAGAALTSATNNTFNGFGAGNRITSGSSNTFVGSTTGSNTTTGSFNSFIGANAGLNSSTGSHNILIGDGADVAGVRNNAVAIGQGAIVGADNSLTLGGTAFPLNVGINTTIPTERLDVVGNVKFSGALMPNNLPGTSGQVLTSAGAGLAPTWTTVGGGGSWALTGNAGTLPATNFIGTTDNIALKFKTNNNISGLIDPVNSNTFFGYIAGQTTTGQQNVAIGTNSLTSNTGGGRNTAVGTAALSSTTGSGNIGIGMSALSTNTTGSNNTAIGFGADVVSGNLSNAIAIGVNSKVAQSNAMALGGTGVDAVNVGINTTSPTERLDVAGNLKFSGALMPNNVPGTPGQVLTSAGGGVAPTWTNIGGGGWSLTGNTGTTTANFIGTTDAQDLVFKTTGTEAFRISSAANNIGIGTASPGSKLEVLGTTRFSDNVTITGFSSHIENNNTTSGQSAGALQVLSSGSRSIDNDAMNIQNLATKSGGSGSTKTGLSILSTGAWAPSTGQTNRGLFVNVAGADNNYSAIFSGGNVGISTISPTERLDVVGNMRFSGALMPNNVPGTAGQVLTSAGAGAPPTWTTSGGSGWGLTGNAGTTPATNFVGTTDAQDLVFRANNTESFRINNGTGNLGIGVTSPQSIVHINNSTKGSLRLTNTATGITASDGLEVVLDNAGVTNIMNHESGEMVLGTSNNSIVHLLPSGNVGLNNASPTQALDVGAGNINVGVGNYMIAGSTVLKNNGTANIFVGAGAGAANSGFNNTFTGASAGGTGATGNFNTFTGANTGGPNTGGNNTFTGADAGGSNTTGGANTFIGRTAGSANTTGSNNVIIGANANLSAGNLTNATAIGSNASVGASNSLVLGNSVNVGIGTSTPEQTLDVAGYVRVASGGGTANEGLILATPSPGFALIKSGGRATTEFQIHQSQNAPMTFFTNGLEKMRIDGAGNVGIGTSPSSPLHVAVPTTGTFAFRIDQNTGTGDGQQIYVNTNLATRTLLSVQSNASGLTVLGNGYTGIGIGSPVYRFHVNETSTTASQYAMAVRKAGTGAQGLVAFEDASGTFQGGITLNGTTVSYNAFTGSHLGRFSINQAIDMGCLISMTGAMERSHGQNSEPIYQVKESTKANDSKILGSYFGVEPKIDKGHLIMSVGNGEVWVVDNGSDLKVGDYLISSDVAGHAAKEDGTFEVANIFAKVAEEVRWSDVTETIQGKKHKRISILFESFIKNNRADKLASDLDETKKEVEALRREIESIKAILGIEAKGK